MTTCAIWCRVSKTEQETANQLDELRQWAQRKGFEVTREYVFEVSASSGSARHREMLGQALADARLGRFEVMLVWALDRVSREGVGATLAILRRFAGHGTPVWSLKEPWTETADPRMAELLASLYAWMAAEESRRRSERTRAGLERRKREGLPVAGSRARRIRSRGAAVGTWPDGSENGPQQAEAGLSSPRAAFVQSGGQEDLDRASITCSWSAWDVRRRPRPAAGIFASWPGYHRCLTTSTVQEGVTQLPPGRLSFAGASIRESGLPVSYREALSHPVSMAMRKSPCVARSGSPLVAS